MPYEMVRLLNSDHPYRYDGTLFGGTKLWTPSQLTTALWLDADSPSSITLNGATVSQWNDKSGNGRHATQATTANQPTYTLNGLNNKPVLTFDGSNDFMDIGLSASIINAEASIIGVIHITTLQTNYNAILAWTASVGPGVSPFLSSGTFGLYSTNVGNGFNIGPTLANTNYLFSLSWTNNGLNASGGLNGANTSATRTSSFTTSVNATLGRDSSAYSSALIGELVVCPVSLSESDRQKIEGYLAWKWGLQANLPVSHPYYSAPPLA